MKTFYFNTGIQPNEINDFPYEYHKKIGNIIRNTLLIPFDCEAPENAEVLFFSNNPNLIKNESDKIKIYRVFNSMIMSKYVYFRVK